MPSRILLHEGPNLEEEELEWFLLQVQGEEEGTEVSSSEEEEGGPGPPPLGLLCHFCRFAFLYVWRVTGGVYLFFLSGGPWGEGDLGHPTITAQAGSG